MEWRLPSSHFCLFLVKSRFSRFHIHWLGFIWLTVIFKLCMNCVDEWLIDEENCPCMVELELFMYACSEHWDIVLNSTFHEWSLKYFIKDVYLIFAAIIFYFFLFCLDFKYFFLFAKKFRFVALGIKILNFFFFFFF